MTVQSVHRNKAPCRVVRASQSASLGLNQAVPGLRSGMVLLSPESKPAGCLFFQVSTSPSSFHFLDWQVATAKAPHHEDVEEWR